jgi:hypothetical protein
LQDRDTLTSRRCDRHAWARWVTNVQQESRTGLVLWAPVNDADDGRRTVLPGPARPNGYAPVASPVVTDPAAYDGPVMVWTQPNE